MRNLFFRVLAWAFGTLLAFFVLVALIDTFQTVQPYERELDRLEAEHLTALLWVVAAGLSEDRDAAEEQLVFMERTGGVPLSLTTQRTGDVPGRPVLQRDARGLRGRLPTVDGRVVEAGPWPPRPPRNEALWPFWVALGVLVIMATIALALPMGRRLAALDQAIVALSAGDLTARAPEVPTDPAVRIARSFNAMAERIVRQLREREELLQAIAHELGTPLSRIELALAMLDAERTEAGLEAATSSISGDVAELAALMEELESWVAAGPDGPPLQIGELDLVEVLPDLVDRWTLLAEERGLELHAEASATATIRTDLALLRRALDNLIRNALSHAASRVVVRGKANEAEWSIVVSDDGPGIPAAERERVVQPFRRLDRTRAREHGGFGLGLAIVQRVATRLNAALVIDDAPEGGALVGVVCKPR